MSKPPKLARFAVINDERGIILGKDIGNIFEKGQVYQAMEMMGEIVLRKMGKYALPKYGCPSESSDVTQQVHGGLHLITLKEQEVYESEKNTEGEIRSTSKETEYTWPC